jgi:predicted Zn-dependent protease
MADVGTSGLCRFAQGAIHQSVTEEVRSLTLSITLEGRTAEVFGSTAGWPGPDGLHRLAAAAVESARLRPADPHWPGLAPPYPVSREGHADRATADASATERAAVVAGFVDAAGGLETAGYCSTKGIASAFANSAGQLVAGSMTAATIDGIARAPSGGPAPADGSGRGSSVHLGALDGQAAGQTAAELARAAAQDPIDVPAGDYTVVLRPGAVVDVLTWIATGMSARPHAEGRSFARLGEEQFDALLTLRCDPFDERMPTLPFDAQGTPRQEYDLIADGVTTTLASDRRDEAAIAGVRSNGSATRHRYLSSALAPALLLRPGTETHDELYAGLRQALLITDFWYTRLLDPRRLVVTGLTRNGVFLIEDGIVVRPVRNLRFTQSYAEALAPGSVIGIDGESVLIEGEPAPVHTPGLALISWAITGGAQG